MPQLIPVKAKIPGGYIVRGNIFDLARSAQVPWRGGNDPPREINWRQITFGEKWDKILRNLKVTDTPNEILSELSQDIEIAVKTDKTDFIPRDEILEDWPHNSVIDFSKMLQKGDGGILNLDGSEIMVSHRESDDPKIWVIREYGRFLLSGKKGINTLSFEALVKLIMYNN